MAAADFKVFSMLSGWLRIRDDNNAAVACEVRLDNIARIILVRGKIRLYMAALVKILGSNSVVYARTED